MQLMVYVLTRGVSLSQQIMRLKHLFLMLHGIHEYLEHISLEGGTTHDILC